jgi:hypothetical protein
MSRNYMYFGKGKFARQKCHQRGVTAGQTIPYIKLFSIAKRTSVAVFFTPSLP